MTDGWQKAYAALMKSAYWRNLRRDVIKLAGGKCQRCGRGHSYLHVHHVNYERLGREMPSDLRVLCEPCYKIEDSLRVIETASRQRLLACERKANRRERALYTYCHKAFDTDDPDGWMLDEAADWLRDKERYQ